jgi:hypothetical protein
MIMNDKLKGKYKEVVAFYFKILSQHIHVGTHETIEIPDRLVGLRTEIGN